MIGKLRFLGLALVAALAMSSVVVSMAAADKITSEVGGTTTLAGKQGATQDIWNTHGGGPFRCTNVTYAGSFVTGAGSVSITPTYSGCTTLGLTATVEMNGCTYLVTADVTKSTEMAFDIVCPAGKEITIKAPSVGTPKCIKHFPPQEDLTKITGTNIGSLTTREITLDINITNLKYSQTAGTAETGNCATADNTTGGTWVGEAILTGSQAGAHVGIFLS